MSSQIDSLSPSNPASAAEMQPAGHWKLRPGRAMTLHTNENGVLRIARGRVWVTTDAPRVGPGNDQGDFFLHAGEHLQLPASRRVVIEPWNPDASAPSYFSWDPDSCVQRMASPAASRWQVAVVNPLRDLTLALGMALHALGRLAWGIGSYGEFLVAGRGRVLPRLESNAP